MNTTKHPRSGAASATDAGLVRSLAESVDCITEGDLCVLASISPATAETWRKRGVAPPYLILGNRPLYLRKGLQAFIEARARSPREPAAAGGAGGLRRGHQGAALGGQLGSSSAPSLASP